MSNDKTRDDLKGYFNTGDIPTESQFADLIESTLNKVDDGIGKQSDGTLTVQVISTDDYKKVLYLARKGEDPTWTLSLSQPGAGALPDNGLGIGTVSADAITTRLFIDEETGHVGIGTTEPDDTFDVNGDIRVHGGNIKDGGGTSRIRLTDNGSLELFDAGGTSRVTIAVDDKVRFKSESGRTMLEIGVNGIYSEGNIELDDDEDILLGEDGWLRFEGKAGITLHDTRYNIELRSYDGNTGVSIDRNGDVGIGGRADSSSKYRLTVNGSSYSTGGWETTKADYAEYFETHDGKPIPEATPVIPTPAGKIRRATQGESPIGIVTTSSAVVGNSYKEWPKKYLRDKFGGQITEKIQEGIKIPKKEKVTKKRQKMKAETVTEEVSRPTVVFEGGKYIRKEETVKVTREVEEPVLEEVELYDATGKAVVGKHQIPVMETYEEEIDVLDDKGEPVLVGSGEFVTVERPKVNPEYDETKEYIPRGERPEWCCVGLLGQLPLRKGEAVAPTWVKLKEVSEDVELWLVK